MNPFRIEDSGLRTRLFQLSKPTKLSELEFSLIKEHARQGFDGTLYDPEVVDACLRLFNEKDDKFD